MHPVAATVYQFVGPRELSVAATYNSTYAMMAVDKLRSFATSKEISTIPIDSLARTLPEEARG